VLACVYSSVPEVGTIPVLITLLSSVAPSGYIAGSRIEQPIAVRLTDKSNRPVPGVQLSFGGVGGGMVTPIPVTTAQDGTAHFYWTLGPYVGLNSLQIYVDGSALTPLDIETTTIAGSVVNLFVTPRGVTLAQGSTLQLLASPSDTHFNPITGAPITWTSTNPGAVSVSSSGLLTAIAPGYATIGASTAGVSASAIVTVPVPAGPGGAGVPPFSLAITSAQNNAVAIIHSDGTPVATISCGAQCTLAGPHWSRDGSMLALTARGNNVSTLLVANADGTNLHEVASAPGYPRQFGNTTSLYWPEFHEDWSSGARLVYTRETSSGTAIETVGADGTGAATVMPMTALPVGNPEWGLGDSMISAVIGGELYLMNADGSNLRKLPAVASPLIMTGWSPDGSKIAFTYIPHAINESPISVLDPVSGALTLVMIPRPRGFCWSPNSSELLAVSNENEPNGWLSIYTAKADGSGITRRVIAIQETLNRTSASWSPDGAFLIYTDDRTLGHTPGSQIYAQSINEGTNTRIADNPQVKYFDVAGADACGRTSLVLP